MNEKYNNGEDVQVGNVYINKKGCVFDVLDYIGNDYNGSKYKVKFRETGYETESYSKSIKLGYVRDPYNKTIANIGYMGEVGEYDVRIRDKWSSMIERCYIKDHKSYKLYGGKGITVDSRWHCFANFLEDFTKIDGYDYNLFNDGLLELDKDKKQVELENKIYSLETCALLTREENLQYRFGGVYSKAKTSKIKTNGYIVNENKEKKSKGVDITGQYFTNIKGYEFKVLSHISNDFAGRKYLVQFRDTGTLTEAYSKCIVKGEVRDPYHPSLYNIGYMGGATGSTTKEYYMWSNMMSRCYNINDTSYKNYSSKGLYVNDRWHSYENFLIDLKYIRVYNKELLDGGLLSLIIPEYQNCYSLASAILINRKDKSIFNNLFMNNDMNFAMYRIPQPDTQMKKAMTRV